MAILGPAKTQSQFNTFMISRSMDVPGNFITVTDVDTFLGNILPPDPTCQECDQQKLARLSYICSFRDDGLDHGRYTGQNGSVFRTYDVKYNHKFMSNYAVKALNAAIRGQKLNNSTPLAFMHHKVANDAHFQVAIDALGKIK